MKSQNTLTDHITVEVGKGLASQLPSWANLRMEVFGPDGRLRDVRDVKNTVTTAGKYGAAEQVLDAPSLGVPTHLAVGTATPGATALGTELARQILDSKVRSNAVVTFSVSLGPGTGTGAITEAGIFDASSVGNMWLSASFAVVNKGASDTLALTWTLTFA